MAGDKRKGKAVAEPKKKKTQQQKEWDRLLSVPDTQGQPQRGIRIEESDRVRGSSPRVSSSRFRSSSSTSLRQRSAARRADRVTSLIVQVRTSDSWRTHPAAADSTPGESCS
jgi:hypothetical protein